MALKYKVGDRLKSTSGVYWTGRVGIVVETEKDSDYPYTLKMIGYDKARVHFKEPELELVENGLETMLRIAFDSDCFRPME